MSHAIKQESPVTIVLPAAVISRADVSRLLREIEAIDNELEGQHVRTPTQPLTIPSMSKSLATLVSENHYDLTDDAARKLLVQNLRYVKDKAPLLHITFAAEPTPDVLNPLVAWAREHLHQYALITTGLQPALIGGCVVRTPDHIYDFSLRHFFAEKKSVLIQNIRTVMATPHEQQKV